MLKKTMAAGMAISVLISVTAQEIVKNGIAKANIVIAGKVNRTEKFAAAELQKWIREISGAKLKIENKKSDLTAIFLGSRFAKGLFDADLKKLKGNDGFAIRNHKGNIYIFGSAPKGTLNGVFAFLELNTDIIWSRPQEFGTNFTRQKTIEITQSNILDIPVSAFRGWQICYVPWDKNTELWQIRMATNRAPQIHLRKHRDSYERSLDGGMKTTYNPGHNLKLYLKKSAFKKHSEYFCLVAGKRRADVGKYQVCFSNMECADHMADEFIKSAEKAKIPFDFMGFYIQDNWNLCECANCKNAIKLPNGKTLTLEDKNYNSTLFFIFLNRIAEKVAKKYPDLKIFTYAYFFTIEPPAVKLKDNIYVMFCPAVKDDKHSILAKKNSRWKKRVDNWSKVTKNLVWREYYGCASGYPRPLADVAAIDLRYLANKLGYTRFFAEYIPDVQTKRVRCDRMWDASAMEFWVISKLYWNPNRDVNKLRTEYLKRTYGKAAPEMKKFFEIIRKSWYSDPTPSTLSDNQYKSAVHYIVEKGFENKCRKALTNALKITDKANVKTNISRTLEHFEDWMKQKSAYAATEVTVPFVANASEALTPEALQWEQAAVINGFRIMGRVKKASQYPTQVKLMWDKEKLYVLFKCEHTTGLPLYTKKMNGEFCPYGDHVELFLSPGRKGATYYHFAVDFANTRYDAKGYDSSWNSSWKAFSKAGKDFYSVICSIPFEEIGINPDKDNIFRAAFFREVHKGLGKRGENSSWGGALVHQPSGFGKIFLKK
jgi:hypothetical protein